MATATTFEEELARHGTLCWSNVGCSMRPLIRQGRDLMVIARKGPEPCRRHDAILFLRRRAEDGAGDYVVHRILKVNEDGTYWVAGDNCAGGEIVREEQILGVLTAVIRDGKRKVPVTSRRYRLYVYLWCNFYPVRFFLIRCRERLRRLYRAAFPRT